MRITNIRNLPACLLMTLLGFAACGKRATPALASTPSLAAVAANHASAAADSARIDFIQHILPIVSQCQPCHFEGGKMYAQLPFDDPETIRKLGTHLFSRIKGEKEQAVLRADLAQKADSTQHASSGEAHEVVPY